MQEGFLAEDDLGASDVYEREDADAQEVCSLLRPRLLQVQYVLFAWYACKSVHSIMFTHLCTCLQGMVVLASQATRPPHPFSRGSPSPVHVIGLAIHATPCCGVPQAAFEQERARADAANAAARAAAGLPAVDAAAGPPPAQAAEAGASAGPSGSGELTRPQSLLGWLQR